MQNKVVVIGSTNIDMVMNLKSLPKPGETIGNGSFQIHHGGKGANQAVGAARSGAEVTFISSIGKDDFSDGLIAGFEKDGIRTDFISVLDDIPTGTALIMVDEKAENCIGVAPEANGKLSPVHINKARTAIQASDYVLLQLEVPKETVEYTIHFTARMNKKIILNPAPASKLSDDIYQQLNILVLNESEAQFLAGANLENEKQIAAYFLKKGVKNVILTLGAKGAFIANAEIAKHIPAFKVKAVDTTAAGDVFCGALSAALTSERTLEEAVIFASAASAIAVTRVGAQPSVPSKEETLAFLVAQES
ncbi:MAG: ribokinase [Bacteroidota bacterium]